MTAKGIKLVRRLWSKDEVRLLKKLFPSRSTREVAAQLPRTLQAIKQKALRIGLGKTRKYLKSLGRK